MVEVSDLVGLTITEIEGGKPTDTTMVMVASDGRRFKFYHDQDCCESVDINEVIGDLSDLIGTPLLEAEESISDERDFDQSPYDSFTWTFYRFATIKGSVTVRWLGASNGYYSERVDFILENGA